MRNVTVITPFFDTQDYLHRCINSVLGQKGVTLQYILIDDGSTDNSAGIARFYAQRDDRVIFVQKRNAGQGVARNIGIRLADSEYIYFVDSDDYLEEDALHGLYEQAKRHDLDICSPLLPAHYYNKPLEYIACLPSKAQFVRLDIIRRMDIFQPAIYSGQDGVFSHLVLTQCARIGMFKGAKYFHTQRSDSTFSSALKKTSLIPGIISQHYRAIEQFYSKHDLWESNSQRLLSFIVNETLKNRLDPHCSKLTDPQLLECFETLCGIAKKAFNYLDAKQQKMVPEVISVLATKEPVYAKHAYLEKYVGRDWHTCYPINDRVSVGGVTICEYANKKLAPKLGCKPIDRRASVTGLGLPLPPVQCQSDAKRPAGELDSHIVRELRGELKALRGKVDLTLNTLNNATIQIASAVYAKPPSLVYGEKNLVVSLTTLSGRLNIVHYAIESIFAQNILPGKIVLWVSDEIDADRIPPTLARLVDRGLEIKQVQDIGPHTKLIYALREFPGKSIVTVDDDIVYPSNMLKSLWDQHLVFPDAVICNWARQLAFGPSGTVLGIRQGKLLTPPLLEKEIEQSERFVGVPNLLAFPYGTSGVLYPPGALNDRVFDVETFSELCPKEDDVWFKAMSLLNGTPVVATNLGINPQHHCLTGSQHVALRHDNHALALNRKQMEAVFQHFDLYSVLRSQESYASVSSSIN